MFCTHCRRHARQISIHARLTPEREHVMGNQGCVVENCEGKHRARGFCAKHYNEKRWQRIKADRGSRSSSQPTFVDEARTTTASNTSPKRRRASRRAPR